MSEKLYEVYEVSYKGVPVYIGSGEQGVRSKHVKSGKSHNVNLNQLFFTDPDNVVISILRENLSQEESLEIYFFVLSGVSVGSNIWNHMPLFGIDKIPILRERRSPKVW